MSNEKKRKKRKKEFQIKGHCFISEMHFQRPKIIRANK